MNSSHYAMIVTALASIGHCACGAPMEMSELVDIKSPGELSSRITEELNRELKSGEKKTHLQFLDGVETKLKISSTQTVFNALHALLDASKSVTDTTVQAKTIEKCFKIFSEKNLINQPPANAADLKKAMITALQTTFLNNANAIMLKNDSVGIGYLNKSARYIMDLFDDAKNDKRLHDALFDAAVVIMGMDNDHVLFDSANPLKLLNETEKNQMDKAETVAYKFADSNSTASNKELTALASIGNKVSDKSLKAKISLITNFIDAHYVNNIAQLNKQKTIIIKDAFSSLPQIDNRTFADIFFEKMISIDQNTTKLDLLKSEQQMTLLKALIDKDLLKDLKHSGLSLFKEQGAIEKMINALVKKGDVPNLVKTVEELKELLSTITNPHVFDFEVKQLINEAINKYTYILIDALTPVTMSPENLKKLSTQLDYLIKKNKDNQTLINKLIVFTTKKAAKTSPDYNKDFVTKMINALKGASHITVEQKDTLDKLQAQLS